MSVIISNIDLERAALEQRWEKTHALRQAVIQELRPEGTRLV
jgi:hypothetical protein